MHSGAGALAVEAQTGVVIDAVDKSYGPVAALRGDLARRRARASSSPSSGPSGCGKSTLLELVCGLTAPDAGRVAAPPAALMPQRDALLPWASALDNAALALRVAGVPRAEARARAHEHFAAFGLEGFESARPGRALGRHAPARRVPAHAAGGPPRALPRRAVRRARRAHPALPAALARRRARARAAHRPARHPRRRGGRAARRPRRAPHPAAGDDRRGARGRACRRPRARDDADVVALRERALEVLGAP